jgi:fermentation-respiration switch protein FrsA (DUF1100 family)
MARARCPVLLVHGTDDLMVPFDDARRLQAVGLPGAVACLAVPGGHDPSDALEEYLPQLVAFLQQSCAAAPSHYHTALYQPPLN